MSKKILHSNSIQKCSKSYFILQQMSAILLQRVAFTKNYCKITSSNISKCEFVGGATQHHLHQFLTPLMVVL